jgi:putative nucleotide binding protein
MEKKEETAIILDFLPHGDPMDGKMMPLAQAVGTKHFTLLQLVPRRDVTLQLKEEVYIGEGKRDKIYYIAGKLNKDKITEIARLQLQEFVSKIIEEQEQKFVSFFNEAAPINARLHQLDLLPGFGVKHMKAILEEREKKPFESFVEIKKRVHNIPDPKKAVERRLLNELEKEERYKLFTF